MILSDSDDALVQDGTFDISYDDGEREKRVRPRLVRAAKGKKSSSRECRA